MTKACQNQLHNMLLLSNIYLSLVQHEPGLGAAGRSAWVSSVQHQESLQLSLCCLYHAPDKRNGCCPAAGGGDTDPAGSVVTVTESLRLEEFSTAIQSNL